MKNILVTIAVPVYGVEKYIERCARSLFEQTYNDIEFLFVDDCTPDRSIDLLRRVMENYPERKQHVTIIRHDQNRGLAAARNTGVDNAKGEFILWVDSDDYIEKNTVEECMKKQSEEDYDFVLFDVVKHLPKRIVEKRNADFSDNLDLTRKFIDGSVEHGVCGGLIRLSLYKDNNIRTIEGVNMSEDYMVTPKLAYNAKRVAQIHQCFYHYDLTNPNSYSNSFSRKKSEDQITVIKNLMEFFNCDNEILDKLHRELILTLNIHVKHSIRDGDNEYFRLSLDRIKKFDTKFMMYLSSGDRLFYQLRFYPMRLLYIKFAYLIKKYN